MYTDRIIDNDIVSKVSLRYQDDAAGLYALFASLTNGVNRGRQFTKCTKYTAICAIYSRYSYISTII